MNLAQVFHADLTTTEHLAAFFLSVVVTAAVLTVWSTLTRTARAAARLARRHR